MNKEQLADLKAKSEAFGVQATLLSNKLEAIQAYIDELPVLMPVQVGLLRLRKDSDKWRLCYGLPGQEETVVHASVAIKASAAVELPRLLADLHERIAESLMEVEAGLSAIAKAEAACQTKS
jgi:hypothetical protein